MTGPEHYLKAEELLDQVRRAGASIAKPVNPESVARTLAEAQVHATLALTAATAMAAEGRMARIDFKAWDQAAGVQPPKGGASDGR